MKTRKSFKSKLAGAVVAFILVINLMPLVTLAAPHSWDGITWDGKTWSGKVWDGKTWRGKTWNSSPFSGTQRTKNPSQNSGDTYSGSMNSTPVLTKPDGDFREPNKNQQNSDFMDSNAYKTGKFAVQGIVMGGGKEIARQALFNASGNLTGVKWHEVKWRHIISGGAQGALSAYLPDNAKVLKTGVDTWTGYSNYKEIGDLYGSYKNSKKGLEAASTASNTVFKSFKEVSGKIPGNAGKYLGKVLRNPLSKDFLGKLTPWTAGVSGVIAAGETVDNVINGNYVKGIGSLGETLMSGAMVMSAVPVVGTTAAAVVGIIGFGLWAGSTIYQDWDGIVKGAKSVWHAVTNPIDTAKKIGKTVSNAVSSAWDTVTGWF